MFPLPSWSIVLTPVPRWRVSWHCGTASILNKGEKRKLRNQGKLDFLDFDFKLYAQRGKLPPLPSHLNVLTRTCSCFMQNKTFRSLTWLICPVPGWDVALPSAVRIAAAAWTQLLEWKDLHWASISTFIHAHMNTLESRYKYFMKTSKLWMGFNIWQPLFATLSFCVINLSWPSRLTQTQFLCSRHCTGSKMITLGLKHLQSSVSGPKTTY